jgi:hypothetical protein
MSCWVREQQRYYRKSLRTKDLGEAKQLATEEYVEVKARLRNGEMVFSKTARALVDEYLAEEAKRVRPQGRHQGGISQGRLDLIRSVLNRHFLPTSERARESIRSIPSRSRTTSRSDGKRSRACVR